MLSKGKEEISQVAEEVVKDLIKQKRTNKEKTGQKARHTVLRTEADINWATMANKVTVPNVAKAGLTLGGGYAGSMLGVAVFTGLGLALGGPSGAAVGYNIGNVVGFGAGAVGGHRFGKAVAQELEDAKQEEIVKKGNTQITEERKIDVEKRKQ